MIAAGPAAAISDKVLARKVSLQLAETRRPGLARLAVMVHSGHVTLRGHVESFYEKQIAIQACRMLTGIERVVVDAVEVAAAG